jgi:hypothetical protein
MERIGTGMSETAPPHQCKPLHPAHWGQVPIAHRAELAPPDEDVPPRTSRAMGFAEASLLQLRFTSLAHADDHRHTQAYTLSSSMPLLPVRRHSGWGQYLIPTMNRATKYPNHPRCTEGCAPGTSTWVADEGDPELQVNAGLWRTTSGHK